MGEWREGGRGEKWRERGGDVGEARKEEGRQFYPNA